MTRTPPAPRKRDKRHDIANPYPLHYHGRWYIVDEMCRCGQPRSEHIDTAIAYGHGGSFDGKCGRFTWHSFVEDPPWVSCTAKEPPQPKSQFLKSLLGESNGRRKGKS